ncbi:MAG TPA: helix-turn-helix domain-containing protein [Streptosporangiaceae bacterium]|nr:helix-turn-helix domain-containing protein [Streptosporangiaceae bacterium]
MRIRRRGEPPGPPGQPGTGPGGAGRQEQGDRGGLIAGPGCVRHRLRADAARNRDAIVAAAKEVFAAQGLSASLEEIAARAGVGIGTLYRRFPARRDLIAAALACQVAEYAAAAERGRAAGDAWAGLAGFVERTCELQASDRGLAELLAGAQPADRADRADAADRADEEVARLLCAAAGDVDAMIGRAKAEGGLRADFTSADLTLVLIAAGAVMHVGRADAPDAWRRFLELTMEGFHAIHAQR